MLAVQFVLLGRKLQVRIKKKKIPPTTAAAASSTRAACEQSKQQVANLQEIVFAAQWRPFA